MKDGLLYEVALTLVPGVGDVNGKKLVAYCGGAEAVFCEKKNVLSKIPGIGEKTIDNIVSHNVLSRAEKELAFAAKHDVRILYYLNNDYPKRLQHCYDAPMILYCKGYPNLNVDKVVGVVGTRNVTDYGKVVTDKIISELLDDDVLVVSGLAYGVDTCAHTASVKFGLKTAAVLAHGLHTIYPHVNVNLARRILEEGGCLLTEQISGTDPDKENFPKRNRIVAGMIDCLIVVESASKGGALITADIANAYDREVFAVPGRLGDAYSAGCNAMIKANKANIMLDVNNLRSMMRWDEEKKVVPKQMKMFREFSEEENIVMALFEENDIVYLDKIITETRLSPTKIASILLMLEFDGILTALPGKRYQKL